MAKNIGEKFISFMNKQCVPIWYAGWTSVWVSVLAALAGLGYLFWWYPVFLVVFPIALVGLLVYLAIKFVIYLRTTTED